jgi:ketosteroid isomerase-like protein
MTQELEAQNREIVLALYKATGRGDWAKAATLTTDDMLIREADTLPFAGNYRGLQALRDLFATVQATLGVERIDMRQITAGGEWVVVLLDLVLAGTPPVRAPLAEAFRLENGKVCEIVPYYFDTSVVAKAVEARKVR